ncbi:MAG: protein secretion system (Wss), protein YukD [Actinomycetia bacterium]|nr:protein secretion system (Wss), protein YukD [Actinomycetes bacterium]
MAFSRVTLVGERCRADVVLPSAEPIGRLMPELLRLVDDRMESPPRLRLLLTADGGVLDMDLTLQQAAIPDGTVLRLVKAQDAPAAPIVHDIAEETGDDLDGRGWRWGPVARRWTATSMAVVAMGSAALAAAGTLPSNTAPALLVAVAAVLWMCGCTAALTVNEPLGTAVTLGGGTVAAVAVQSAATLNRWPEWGRWSGWALIAAVLLVLLGASTPLSRGGVVGSWFAAVPALAWLAGAAAGLALPRLAAAMSVVTAIALGVLPRLALAASGLATLDDRRAAGAEVARRNVAASLTAAHRGLSIATIATAVSAAAAGLVLVAAPDRWTVPLALLLVFVVASRSRVFPLVTQVVALQAAVVAIVLGLLVAWTAQPGPLPYGPTAAAAGGSLIPLAVLAARPSEHVRARLRRMCDRVEAAAVIAIIPVAIGVFGTYGRLLHVFT